MVVDKDGVMKMSMLTAEAVELGRRILDLSFAVAGQVSDSHSCLSMYCAVMPLIALS